MTKRNLCVKVDEEVFRQVKVKIANESKTTNDYLLELILEDLERYKKGTSAIPRQD